MDLVEVAPTARPPVCKIMDYGKWRYQQQKKEDKSRASVKGGRLKQLNIDTVRIGDHDLEIKINRARDFLEEGNKVQFTLRFKGREMAHQDLGYNLLRKIKIELWQFSKVERDAKMEGRRMTLVLQPDRKAPGAKMPTPGAPMTRPPAPVGASMNIPRPPDAAAAEPEVPLPPGVSPALARTLAAIAANKQRAAAAGAAKSAAPAAAAPAAEPSAANS